MSARARPLTLESVFDTLGLLVQKSLVEAHEQEGRSRYGMLETIREHALEHLTASGEEHELRSRHLEWFEWFLERSEAELAGPEQLELARRIQPEFGNVRAALYWSLADGDIEAALSMVAHRRFWQYGQGYIAEGRSWIEAVLERADDADPALRARALAQAGEFQRINGDMDRAHEYLEQALAVQREVEDGAALGRTLYMLGRVELAAGRSERAGEVTAESVALARSAGDKQLMGERLAQMGEVEYHSGSPARAGPPLQEALSLAREAGDVHSVADSLRVLGMIARDAGDIEMARSCLDEALSIQRGLADFWCVSLSLSVLGDMALLGQEPSAAGPLFAEALSIQSRIGHWYGMADSLWGLAASAAGAGFLERSARLFGAEEAFRGDRRIPFRVAPRERYDTALSEVRERMEPSAFADAWQEGRQMGLEQAVTYGLGDEQSS